jgi:hypothetical protein
MEHSVALYFAETWTLHKVDQKCLERFETWCWWRMEKISWTDRVRNEKVLHRVKEERNIIHTIQRMMANWIGQILSRNCLIKHNTERRIGRGIKVTGRQGRRRTQLLNNLKQKRWYWKLSGRIKSHSVENSLWTRLWTRRNKEQGMVIFVSSITVPFHALSS